MNAKKIRLVTDFERSLDYLNFNSVDNNLPILDIVNERFLRNFRVSLSSQLHTLCNVNLTSSRLTLKEWLEENNGQSCLFLNEVTPLNSAVFFKFDRDLMNGIIDILAGGTGKGIISSKEKEITMIELSIMQSIAKLAIDDLNVAWNPVFRIDAKCVRTEVNPRFTIYEHPSTKLISMKHKVEFAGIVGVFEVIYPYSFLFPIRDILFK